MKAHDLFRNQTSILNEYSNSHGILSKICLECWISSDPLESADKKIPEMNDGCLCE